MEEISKRIFIVGVARSGTTLLQSMVGAHSEIYTLPETHFFDGTLHQNKLGRFFQIISDKEKNKIINYCKELDLDAEVIDQSPKRILSKKKWGVLLFSIIDKAAKAYGKNIWLEKTPKNIKFIDLIEKTAFNSKFIHIIREPIDNIASLYEASTLHSESFKQKSIDSAIDRYETEFNISKKYLGKHNHFHLNYENLVDKPAEELKQICNFLNIDFDPVMLNYSESAEKIISSDEKWKNKNIQKLQRSSKKEKIFSQKEIDYIKNKTSNLSTSIFKNR